jgi:hypothetical protein
MRADAVSGAFFYLPGSGSSQPPPADDPAWNLMDGGRWQGDNQYPIYALSGTTGAFVVEQLALYSGNISTAPNSDILVPEYGEDNTIRLLARIDVSGGPGIPSLWVFLIIVLAILLAIVLTTSVVMHLIQRRQRRRLAERVSRGEVDLETLGIKRLNVPQNILDKMPVYTYTSMEPIADATTATGETPASPTAPTRSTPYSQPVCPICLDDFVHNETQVRELPCAHIFHPECIDNFLKDNSSLCPMCKKSSLPVGYCPVNVTNIMVRRERLVRRMRARASGEMGLVRAIDAEAGHGLINYQFHRLRARITGRQAAAAGLHSSAQQTHASNDSGNNGATELANVTRPPPAAGAELPRGATQAQTQQPVATDPEVNAAREEVPAEIAAQGASARRAWLRERFVRREQARFEDGAAQAQMADAAIPKCKLLSSCLPSRAQVGIRC